MSNRIEIITITFSSLSMIFSLSVVAILLYRYDKLVLGKSLLHHVLIIAICDSMVSFSYALGYPRNEGLCSFQGFLSLTTEKASWLWTDMLMLNIYGIVICSKYIFKLKAAHVIVWTMVFLFSFLPFINGGIYGISPQYLGKRRCGYAGGSDPKAHKHFWTDVQNTICLGSICFIVFIVIRIYVYKKGKNDDQSLLEKGSDSEALTTMILYPMAMICCWLPSQIYNYICPPEKPTNNELLVNNIFHILAPQYGLCLSIIFYSRTKKAREELLKIIKPIHELEEQDIEIRDSSTIVRIT